MDDVEAFVDAVKKLSGEIHFSDGVLDVGQPGGEELHSTSVLGDGEIPMHQVAELGVEDHGATCLVVTEDQVQLGPDVEGGARRGSGDVHQLVSDDPIEPQDYG